MAGGAASGSGGNLAWLPPQPSIDELLALADEPDPIGAQWTRAGRALQKHGYRPTGSVYPRVTGPPSHYNSVAKRIVEVILNDPRSVVMVRGRRWRGQEIPFLEVRAADGRKLGYRWDPSSQRYRFTGFREP